MDKISKYDKLINCDSDILFGLIEEKNKEYKRMSQSNLQFDNSYGVSDNMICTAKKFNCYLGFDTDFKWIDNIHDEISANPETYKLIGS